MWYKRYDVESMFILGKLLDIIVREKGVIGYPSGYGSMSPVGGLNIGGQLSLPRSWVQTWLNR